MGAIRQQALTHVGQGTALAEGGGQARSLSDIGSCSILCCQIWRHEMAPLHDVVAYEPGLRNVGQVPKICVIRT